MKKPFFEYGHKEIDYLKSRCNALGNAIDRIGHIKRGVNPVDRLDALNEGTPNLFADLLSSIVGQQISAKAAATVWGRIEAGLGQVNPENILAISHEQLQAFGISFRKASYIRGAAEAVATGRLDMDGLWNLPDEAVIKSLSALNGVGVWTAEMLLLFSMGRPNILSFGDLVIHKGLKALYGLDGEKILKKIFDEYRELYSPYASVASLYLWEIGSGKGAI